MGSTLGNLLRIVVGLGGLVWAARSMSRTFRLRRDGVRAAAVVVESHRSRGRTMSTVHYVDDTGTEQVAFLPGQFPVGANVEVTYLPGRKDRVTRSGDTSFTQAYAILAATAAAMALTLLIS